MQDKSGSRRWSRIFKLDPRKEISDELAFHVEQRERDYIARGLTPEAARSAALERLGNLEDVRRDCAVLLTQERRAEVRRDLMKFSLLDFKLGLRMLGKYPGITVVGGLAIAFATAIGAATFELVTQVAHPRLPLPDGDRIVSIQMLDAKANDTEDRTLHDLANWRRELTTIQELGAYREVPRNLVSPDGDAAPVKVAEISVSAFRIASVPPLMGRHLLAQDEQPGAQPVVVIGERVWRSQFKSDPDVIGRSISLGNQPTTVVGVMPESFGFPINSTIWTPLRFSPEGYQPREGPRVRIFGRLAPAVTLDQAQAELSASSRRTLANSPRTHEHLRPQVLPFGHAIMEVSWTMFAAVAYSVNGAVFVFLLLVCANVAALVLARTAARENEIVVRNALGASRGRIVTQLFAEALVLGGVAATLGLVAAAFGLRWGLATFEAVLEPLPFWISDGIAPRTALYTALITVLGAVVIGVVPALKVTGKGVQNRLRQSAVGGAGMNFGKFWTSIIVAQIAVTVVFVGLAMAGAIDIQRARSVEMQVPTEEYLSVRLEADPESQATVATELSETELKNRLGLTYSELERQLENDPGVSGVTFATLVPRMDHPQRRVEVEDAPAPTDTIVGRRVSSAIVALDYFYVLRAGILSGRGFHSGDLAANRAVIVNQAFVDKFLSGRNPIGRRVRYIDPERDDEAWALGGNASEWHEIIGVVGNLGMTVGDPGEGAGIYHPAAPGDVYPLHMLVRVKGQPRTFQSRFREIAIAVDPGLRLHSLQPLNEIQRDLLTTYWFWFRIGLIAAGLVLLLSLAGIYSIMSFTVARRTREIGIRIALGADRRRIVFSIFAKALMQIGLGITLGSLLIVLMAGGIRSLTMALLLAGAVIVMTTVSLLACVVPTRRAFRIEPTEAMRAADG